MTYQPAPISEHQNTLPLLPGWVTAGKAGSPEDGAFLSGAALAHLHQVLNREDVPQALLRNRLALRAAEACVTRQGRPERAAELRDALAFLQPGDSPGPAGERYRSWRRAVARPVSVKILHRALPDVHPDQIAIWLDAGQGTPVLRAAFVLQAVLAERLRDDATGLILADAALAQALGWTHLLPCIALGLKRGDLSKTGEELRLACHRAVVATTVAATREAADLARHVTRLREIVPKLRAKGAEEAVTMFLNEDAVTPGDLASLRSDRAARRFCDRLVELGAVRELTGRDTFRLYGV